MSFNLNKTAKTQIKAVLPLLRKSAAKTLQHARARRRSARGMALWLKLLLGFVAFCTLVFFAIAGIIAWYWYQAVNPTNIQKVASEMVLLEPLPADMKYLFGLDFPKSLRLIAIADNDNDALVLVGFPNKSQLSPEDFLQSMTGASFKAKNPDNVSKDELAARAAKNKKTVTNSTDGKSSTSATADKGSQIKITTTTTTTKVSSSDPDDKTLEDLHKHTQSPRSSTFEVQKQGEVELGGSKLPYVCGTQANHQGTQKTYVSMLICAALSPDTDNLIIPLFVQNIEQFDTQRAQKYMKLIKGFKNPSN